MSPYATVAVAEPAVPHAMASFFGSDSPRDESVQFIDLGLISKCFIDFSRFHELFSRLLGEASRQCGLSELGAGESFVQHSPRCSAIKLDTLQE